MITYKRCTEVSEDAIFKAFQDGFSDYIIKIELTKDLFLRHFFGPEGNSPEYSVIAIDGEKPVGLNLGGIRVYDGVKTLRCGALCVHPDYRGTEVSHRLFDMHKEIANENNCRQLFLEVIAGNDRAVSFYIKKGYEKVYDLVYYSHSAPAEIKADLPDEVSIQRIDTDSLRDLREELREIHINWQNEIDYIEYMKDQVHYGVFIDSKLIGGLSIHPSGKISFLWVDSGFRYKGIGKGLIGYAVREINPKKLTLSFPDNEALLGFAQHLGFARDSISQYEMYLTL